MNIFLSDACPLVCAQALDDRRLVKMVLETAQLLSTTHHVLEGPLKDIAYKPTHKNHPCATWARASSGNYFWLCEHFKWLCTEYTYRFGKKHQCEKLFGDLFYKRPPNFPAFAMTFPANCTPHKDMPTIQAYRLTLADKWRGDQNPRWTKRGQPEWKNNY